MHNDVKGNATDLAKPDIAKPETTNKDTLYAEQQGNVPRFVFDEKVVDVFPDMINRSVPGYSAIIMMIGQLAARYAQPHSHCYDLGCSLGGATFAMSRRIEAEDVQIVAVDSSEAMIHKLASLLEKEKPETKVHLLTDDILNIDINKASVVVLNFTLQFIPLEKRQHLLTKIADGMLPGGVLVLSEKITFDDRAHDELVTDMHHFFKATNGYSEMEIAQKRTALENVLVPETLQQHKTRLQACGFKNTNLWFQCFNFASLLAFK